MQVSFFGDKQPDKTYYYMPINVFNFGVVNTVNIVDGRLTTKIYAHLYTESKAKKGGNNVALLIIKSFKMLGITQSTTGFESNIIFANCSGQNKKNTVFYFRIYFN